jgi:hypothetical protein
VLERLNNWLKVMESRGDTVQNAGLIPKAHDVPPTVYTASLTAIKLN